MSTGATTTQGGVRWIKAFVGLQLPDGDEWLVDNRGRPIKGLDLDMADSGAVIAEAADVAMLRRIEGAVRQGLRLQAILVQRFGYVDEFGIPLQPDDLARLAGLIERGGTG